jgi:hypothetical protein|tara:strand:- start:6 stop:371 length:366 start_codon:yes stop_codon:yes gene_type:complete
MGGVPTVKYESSEASSQDKIVITCYLKYTIDPKKTKEFETYAKLWIPLVEQFGGQHHGYFLPSEGANDIALALFSFASLADYEVYRKKSFKDEKCKAAFAYADESGCILRFERSFLKPILK